jgi:nucleotide-binding universal stress UspA family protein
MTDTSDRPIVVGVDGSPDSQSALGWAVDEAQRRKRTLQLICAWQSDYGAETMAPMASTIEDRWRAVVDAAAERAAALAPDLPVVGETVHLQAASALIAASRHADSVVVGSRGLGAVREAFAGSTSMQVASHASCPVVVVREVPSRHDSSLRVVVVGVDGSDLSTEATRYAFEEAWTRWLPRVAARLGEPQRPASGPLPRRRHPSLPPPRLGHHVLS